MVLDPTSSTAYEPVPLHDKSKTKLSQEPRKPFKAFEGFPFIPKSKLPPILRLIIFLLLEVSFLALSIICLLKPIPLPISNDDSDLRQAKAATTAIAIVWHTVAVFMAQDLTINVFSAECMAQYHLTGRLRPGETDRVSAIHTGLISWMKHFVSPAATARYRVAFAGAIALMVLGPIGPSVLTIGSVQVQTLERVSLRELLVPGALYPTMSFSAGDRLSERAKSILKMETQENGTIGFGVADERVLIPWPPPDLKYNQEEIITYWTDVATYDYKCSWDAPLPKASKATIDDYLLDNIMEVGGIPWRARLGNYLPPYLRSPCDGDYSTEPISFEATADQPPAIIVPLVNTAILDMYPPPTDSSISGFFLIWKGSAGSAQNLSFPSTDNYTEIEPRARILLCDPHFKVLSGEVRLEGGKLHLNRLANDSSRIGNLAEDAANCIFTQALVSAVEPDPYVSDAAVSLFLTSEDFLPLNEINHNMNTYLQIAAKAYLSGTYARTALAQGYLPRNVTRSRQNPALASSKPFLLALAAIVASLAVLLLSLHVMVQRLHDIQLFDLQNFTIREKD